jgi:LysM repeat protein
MENFKVLILQYKNFVMKLKYFVLQIFFLVLVLAATAQEKFTTYTVKKGETLSSISHHFHIPVEKIKEANGLTDKSILKVGQKIKIPSKAAEQKSVEKSAAKQTSETSANTAVSANRHRIHIVTEKETLWSIGKKYGITVAQIKEWNHLTGDGIHNGQKLLVMQPEVEQAPETVAQAQPQPETSQQEPVVEQKPAPVEQQAAPVEKPVNIAVANKSAGESFFASAFRNTGNQLSGIASTFKTASGWLDKKYYVLINNVTEGSIVAVTANNKTVYAKVLGSLPDIKEDNGVLLRINNAAASALGVIDMKFDVMVNY